MAKFNVGDKVRLICYGMIGYEADDWARRLDKKESYLIQATHDTQPAVMVDGWWVHQDHFEIFSIPEWNKENNA